MNEPEIQSIAATIADEKALTSTEGTPRYLGRIVKNVNVKAQHLNGWNRHWHAQAFVRIVFWILPTMYYLSWSADACL
jgi:hypothetical protein